LARTVFLLVTRASIAADRFWDGGAAGADANWTSANNWSNNVAPVAGDFLLFPAGISKKSVTNNFAAGTDFAGFSMSDDYVLFGNSADISNSVGTVVSATKATVSMTLRQLNGCTVDIASGTILVLEGALSLSGSTCTMAVLGTMQVDGIISGSRVSSQVSKSGAGTLILNGANTYPGVTTVGGGTLEVNGVVSNVTLSANSRLAGEGTVGSGSSWSNATDLVVGNSGPRNRLDILDGGRVATGFMELGRDSTSTNNTPVISENGSELEATNYVSVGTHGFKQQLAGISAPCVPVVSLPRPIPACLSSCRLLEPV